MPGKFSSFTDPPVFLQTGFRTSGTWLWSRFRIDPAVMAFYEPLNEVLATLSIDQLERMRPRDAGLHHPALDEPYFAEFRPLLQGNPGGVRLFDKAFALQGYFDPPAVPNRKLQRYLQGLIDLANEKERQPVLKFTRALGRAAWLRRYFPAAIQIMLRRCPMEQFHSGWRLHQETGNPTFLMIPLYALSRAERGPLRRLCGLLDIPHIPSDIGLGECVGHYNDLARKLEIQTLIAAFLAMQLVAESLCEPHVDLVIEASCLETAPMRRLLERSIQDITGFDIDLSGFVPVRSNAPVRLPAGTEDICRQICMILKAEHPAAARRLRDMIDVPHRMQDRPPSQARAELSTGAVTGASF